MAKADKKRSSGKKKRGPAPKTQEQRKQEVVLDAGVPCPHCGNRYNHRITNTYPNGNHRRICGGCNQPFMTIKAL